MKDLLFFSEAFAEMNRFHYNKGKSFAKKIGRRIMKKIDAHLHLVRDLASYKGNGRSNALGNGLVVWDSGFKTRLFPAGWGDDAFRADAARKVMEDHDVAKAVLLQGSLYGFQNYYSWQVAKAAPDRFAPAFSIDPFASEAEKIVKRHVEDLGFRALKLEVSQAGGLMGYHLPFDLAEDDRFGKILDYLSSYPGFAVAVDYGDSSQASHQPRSLARLAKRYPDLDLMEKNWLFLLLCRISALTWPPCKTSRVSRLILTPSARKRWAWPRKSWGPKGSYGAATHPGQPLSMITASFIPGWKTQGFFQKRNWLMFIMATRKEFISRQTTWRL